MITITGGAGFIGSALVWHLNQLGEDNITIVDSLGSGDKWKNLRALRFRHYIEKEDFLEELPKLGSQRAIIHLGACTDTTERDASYLVQNNYEYTKAVIEYAVEHHIRMIYASSAAVYGDGAQGYDDDPDLVDTLRPLNMYGYSKLMVDHWAHTRKIMGHVASLKFFNVFGPNEYHKGHMRSVAHKAWEQIKQDGVVRLFKSHHPDYADGEQMRDFVYVKDVVAIICHLMDMPALCGFFNVGSGQARSWRDLATAVFKALDLTPNIEYIPMPSELRGKYQYFTQAKLDRLREIVWQQPFTSLEDAVHDYVRNYLEPGVWLGDPDEEFRLQS
jgi:ADP-L-glycero-D-manno-heptose 6-epimerase